MRNRIIQSIHRDTRKVVFRQQSGFLDDMYFIEATLRNSSVSEWFTAGEYSRAEARFAELTEQLRNEDSSSKDE